MNGADIMDRPIGKSREYRVIKWNGEPLVDNAYPFEMIQTGDTDQVLPTTVTTFNQESGQAIFQFVTFEREELHAYAPRVVEELLI
jgi:hypothetical protein